jgi:CRISPR-associated endonuclease Csn1
LAEALKRRSGVTAKTKELLKILLNGKKPEKSGTEEFPFSQDSIIRLLAGGQCKLKDVFCKEEYLDLGSISLDMDEDKFGEISGSIGEDYDLLMALRGLYDWSVLADLLNGHSKTISAAKVQMYEQHKEDLRVLKYFMHKYLPGKYNEVFRKAKADNYVAYTGHMDKETASQLKKKANVEDFSRYIQKLVRSINPEEKDQQTYQDMCERLELKCFLPKQRSTNNRVIPHQLYEYELIRILKNASLYLPFLNEVRNGVSEIDKVVSIFRYKLPYYVGPLNEESSFAWISRKQGKITPWNFKDMVDEDTSENVFIRRMTNKCTYLPGEDVLPKDSLCYQKFMVLNELNNLKIDGRKVPVEVKQGIYHELFEKKKKVRRKDIEEYLISNNYLAKGSTELISGIDEQVHSCLSSYSAFRNLLSREILSENDVEKIIERASYAEDKSRVKKWLRKEYPDLSQDDVRYITKIKIKEFGKLSRTFLTELKGCNKQDGEMTTILRIMWETNDNLMEILSDKYTFREAVEAFTQEYYTGKKKSLKERLDEMRVSNSVRRPVYRTLAVVKDIEKAFGKPDKIFVEMTRGGQTDQKRKRTKSRKQQILDLYDKCKDDVHDLMQQLESMGEYADSRLQSDRLYLYFMQFGKCAYSGAHIGFDQLMAGSVEYDIDHIYPQSYVKDDSLNNKVLVLSDLNGTKDNIYPVSPEIRGKMQGLWSWWNHVGAISDEKYKRLIRSAPFTDEEKMGFINRQLTETSQSTKFIADLLKERFPDAEVVYVKAGLVSDFRHEFDLPKSRSYNDLHNAADAFLSVVAGNVYDMRFSKKWFRIDEKYSVKVKTIFTHEVKCRGDIIWDGMPMLEKVEDTARKNTAHFVKYAAFKTGGLFDQNPVKKGTGLIPLKAGLPTEKYGGYNKAGIMFLIPVRYNIGKKSEILILPVELMHGKHFLEDKVFARNYTFTRLENILGKKVGEVSFPMGMRPWKINTMLSFDGFRVCLTGTSGRGKCLVAQPVMQFSADEHWRFYVKRLERFVEKIGINPDLLYDKDHDKVSKDENLKLYELYVDKLQNTIYKKRVNSPVQTLLKGKEEFKKLSIEEQCQVLLNIQSVFGRMTGGCDLTLIGGSAHSAATGSLSTTISNWKKKYSTVRIIDQSPSGMWEKSSENLLDFL